ncbi:hypothetical protein MIMGU_mgv1a021528mg, partial [Erythranthe guttata]
SETNVVDLQCEGDDVGVDFLTMLTSGEGSGVVLNVGGEKFHAHKVILSACSSVFESMFASHLTISDQHAIVISDVEPQMFKRLSLAGKYNASELKHLCFEYAFENYAVLVELDSFRYLEKNCPLVLDEMNG